MSELDTEVHFELQDGENVLQHGRPVNSRNISVSYTRLRFVVCPTSTSAQLYLDSQLINPTQLSANVAPTIDELWSWSLTFRGSHLTRA